MKKQRFFLMLSVIFMVNMANAQMTDYLVPINYHNPLLRSGQFMTSLYFSQNNLKTELNSHNSESKDYSVHFACFLGLTDWMTLSTRLRYIPEQTILEMTGDRVQEDTQDATFHPEFILSLRPKPNIEIFGSVFLFRNQYAVGDAIKRSIDPISGYPMPDILIPGYDFKTSGYELRCGFSYAGSLW